jgi:hypothetical protein
MRWEEHVAPMVQMENSYTNSVVKPEERDHLEDLGVDGR